MWFLQGRAGRGCNHRKFGEWNPKRWSKNGGVLQPWTSSSDFLWHLRMASVVSYDEDPLSERLFKDSKSLSVSSVEHLTEFIDPGHRHQLQNGVFNRHAEPWSNYELLPKCGNNPGQRIPYQHAKISPFCWIKPIKPDKTRFWSVQKWGTLKIYLLNNHFPVPSQNRSNSWTLGKYTDLVGGDWNMTGLWLSI